MVVCWIWWCWDGNWRICVKAYLYFQTVNLSFDSFSKKIYLQNLCSSFKLVQITYYICCISISCLKFTISCCFIFCFFLTFSCFLFCNITVLFASTKSTFFFIFLLHSNQTEHLVNHLQHLHLLMFISF